MKNLDKKAKVALLSIVSNTTLIVFKVIAGLLSGSISLMSEAIHSGMDCVASVVAFLSVKHSSKPADRQHPYGHGKLENISGLAEGVLIFVAAGMIIYEAVKKLFEPVELGQAYIAMGVMFVSALVNFLVSNKLHKVAKEEDSMALEADSLHLKTDVYTSLGVAIGIVLIKLTGIAILDPIAAIIVALFIIKEAWVLSKSAFDYLLDVKLSDEEEAEIEKVVRQHGSKFIDFHKLKTRKSGSLKHIDFHITLNSNTSVLESHKIIGELKKDLNDKIKNTRVNVHVDPYKMEEVSDETDID